MKDKTKKMFKKEKAHFRKKYIDHSRRFLDWVNELGFEQTFLGGWLGELERRYKIRRLGYLFGFCFFLCFLLFYDFEYSYNEEVGEIASRDILSPISFQLVDEAATEEKREQATLATPPIFDYDPDVYEPIYNRVYKSFREMRGLVRQVKWSKNESIREEQVKAFLKYKSQFEDSMGVKVSPRIFEWLTSSRFNVRIENILIRTLVKWSNFKIVDGLSNATSNKKVQLVIKNIASGDRGEQFTIAQDSVLDIRKREDFSLDGIRGAEQLPRRDRKGLLNFARKLQVPNLTFNKKATTDRIRQAREAVLPIQISIQKNQTIVQSGQVIQPIHELIMERIRNLKADHRTDFIALITALLFFVLLLVFFSYMRRFSIFRVMIEPKDIKVMAIVSVAIVCITKFFLFVTNTAFVSKYGDLVPASVFLYAAPIAAGPMLVGLLITSGEVVWIFTTFLAVALSFMMDMDFGFLIFALVGGIAAARGVYGCEKRNDIYWAGLRTGFINAVMITFLTIMAKLGSGGILESLMWNVPAGFVGGILSSMLAMTLVSLLESGFSYTTDVKLLELSSLTHPLMRDLMVKAPGTYHHCLSVGTMVEEAALKIGANALLAKVMAYYHDIGKMEHPQYFIENQRPGYNPHDHISPHMSKTVIVAHVKDGAEMAINHNLGKPIVDGILQHHGTTMISYFYNKALDAADDEIEQIDESEFRYPGPKPQFKEAALVMLADSIEAAARCIDEPTAGRLTHLVENIMHGKFMDGQLSECNLTFQDLSLIDKSFKKTILNIYHSRIEYPNLRAPKEAKENQAKLQNKSQKVKS